MQHKLCCGNAINGFVPFYAPEIRSKMMENLFDIMHVPKTF